MTKWYEISNFGWTNLNDTSQCDGCSNKGVSSSKFKLSFSFLCSKFLVLILHVESLSSVWTVVISDDEGLDVENKNRSISCDMDGSVRDQHCVWNVD